MPASYSLSANPSTLSMWVFTGVYHIQNSVQVIGLPLFEGIIFDKILPIGDNKRSSATHHANDFCEKKNAKLARFQGKKFWNCHM